MIRITSFINYIDLLDINEEFHLNIIFIYVTTPIFVMIFSLRSKTHGKLHSITISFNNFIILKRILQTEWEFQFYSNVTLQSITLGTWEIKLQVTKLRIVCSWEFVHIRVKEASQKNKIMKLYEGTIYYY
jgi:hypothetical protein